MQQNKILYGGDYNPEQWSEEVWQEDMRLFKLAHIDVVTLNVFSWASLQPDENTYDFSKLDKIMELVKENGLKVCLATLTAVHPAWMARKYPDVLRTEHNGIRRKFGSRHNSCPNSPTYRKYSAALASQLAKRYGKEKNIVAWHVANEYGGECYCENCEKTFREWLKEKYGTIEELNRVWNLSFWGHTMYDWEDVVVPNMQTEEWIWEYTRTNFQGISLDYRRFQSESMLACYKLERDELKKLTPDIPVTTNLMGFYKPLDYQKWAKEMDFVSWDNYPTYDAFPAQIAMCHDLIRGLKQGRSFWLMEQTPGVTNWHPYCALKRPGVMRLWSYQAVAHGSDTVMFFQMRRSIGACEKYHSAVIDHAGHENTRVFREITELGAELDKIGGQTLGATIKADVAIVFDWDNWWSSEYSAGPSKLISYHGEVQEYYRAFSEANISVDIISMEDDISGYKMVIAPLLYMCKDGYDTRVRKFVQEGGCFLTTYFSGYVEDHDLVVTGGYPARLRDILGIWVEESDAIIEGNCNHFHYDGKQYPATILCDLLHLEGAKALSTYEEDFYAGMPVLTEHDFGRGKAYYVATRSNGEFYRTFIRQLCQKHGIIPVMEAPDGIEATVRENENGSFLFILNHNNEASDIVIPCNGTDIIKNMTFQKGQKVTLASKDVLIIKKIKQLAGD